MLHLWNIRFSDGSSASDIEIDDGKESCNERDMSAFTAVPGFFDPHIHGSFGFDVSDGNPEDIISLSKKLPAFGVSEYLPTLMTLSEEDIFKVCDAVMIANNSLQAFDGPYAGIYGIRLEGPFLNPLMSGVQNEDLFVSSDRFSHIIENVESRFPGLLKMIDIAPELDGALDLVREYKDRYVISLAHSDSGYETAKEFFLSGGSSLTHALNAMRPCLKRDPGPLGAAFDSGNVYIELICDGHHVDPSVIRMLFKLFEDRVIVISDAMRAGGMPDGTYSLGGVQVRSENGRTFFGPDGNLAGSVTNLAQEAVRLRSYGIPEDSILHAMTCAPRKRFGIDLKASSGGKMCSLNFVDPNLRLLCVISRGRLVSPDYML